eukprot:5105495-Amphidinium_carterae.1
MPDVKCKRLPAGEVNTDEQALPPFRVALLAEQLAQDVEEFAGALDASSQPPQETTSDLENSMMETARPSEMLQATSQEHESGDSCHAVQRYEAASAQAECGLDTSGETLVPSEECLEEVRLDRICDLGAEHADVTSSVLINAEHKGHSALATMDLEVISRVDALRIPVGLAAVAPVSTTAASDASVARNNVYEALAATVPAASRKVRTRVSLLRSCSWRPARTQEERAAMLEWDTATDDLVVEEIQMVISSIDMLRHQSMELFNGCFSGDVVRVDEHGSPVAGKHRVPVKLLHSLTQRIIDKLGATNKGGLAHIGDIFAAVAS